MHVTTELVSSEASDCPSSTSCIASDGAAYHESVKWCVYSKPYFIHAFVVPANIPRSDIGVHDVQWPHHISSTTAAGIYLTSIPKMNYEGRS